MLITCSKHNYTGINHPCPDCEEEDFERVWSQVQIEKQFARILSVKFEADKIVAVIERITGKTQNQLLKEYKDYLL